MINTKTRDEIVKKFTEDVERTAEEVRGRIKLYSYYKAGVYDVVREGIHDIQKIIERQLPLSKEEVNENKVAIHVSFTANTISVIMKNKFESCAVKFKEKFAIVIRAGVSDDTIYDECFENMFTVYENVLVDILMRPNVYEFNKVLGELTEAAGLDYKVSVTRPYQNDGKKISVLTDDEVVFVCDQDRIFDIDTLTIMQTPVAVAEGEEPVGLTQEAIDEAKKAMSDLFATAQTTAEFVENKGFPVIQFVCDLPKLKKPITYMNKIANKNIMNNKKAYDGLYFYYKDNVFALAEAKDGAVEVVFSPIDVNTFKRVEGIDVTGSFKAE
jgi:hypothetical protein